MPADIFPSGQLFRDFRHAVHLSLTNAHTVLSEKKGTTIPMVDPPVPDTMSEYGPTGVS